MSNQGVNNKYFANDGKPSIEAFFGPYATLEAALLAIPSNFRQLGREVGIVVGNVITRYELSGFDETNPTERDNLTVSAFKPIGGDTDLTGIEAEITAIKGIIREPANYVQPTISITNVTQTVEKGTTLSNVDVDITFTPNDAGAASSYILRQTVQSTNTDIGTSDNNTVTISNIENTVELTGIVAYSQGILKNDNLGQPDPTGQIQAGSINSSIRTITPRLRMWYQATSVDIDTSAEVRALVNDVWDNQNSITLQTGTTETNFVVAVPSSKTTASTLSAQDTSNNIGLTYTFTETVTVNLPTGTEEYRIYKLTIGNPYPTSANHVIQL